MNTTQDHVSIKDISDDIVFLKTGGGVLILQVSAVNFGLLSEREQFAIIESFAQMLNSLSFLIQIVIRSKRLNISSYLNLLDKAQKTQTNRLLSQMMTSYRLFIQTLIKENEVLDKKFYVVIPLFKLELGLIGSREALKEKIKTVLLPRRDQVVKQLARAGLKATRLTSEKLLELFFDIYNEVSFAPPLAGQTQSAILKSLPVRQAGPPASAVPKKPAPTQPQAQPVAQPNPSRTHPFVVEELEEM